MVLLLDNSCSLLLVLRLHMGYQNGLGPVRCEGGRQSIPAWGNRLFIDGELASNPLSDWTWANGRNKYLSKRTARKTIFQSIHYFSPHLQLFFSFFSFFLFQWFYYFGIIEDLILRFSWTLSMSLIQAGYIEGDVMMTILSPLEVFRRFIWNYFRLENEHLNNVGKFRAVRDISVAPMDCSDQV